MCPHADNSPFCEFDLLLIYGLSVEDLRDVVTRDDVAVLGETGEDSVHPIQFKWTSDKFVLAFKDGVELSPSLRPLFQQ